MEYTNKTTKRRRESRGVKTVTAIIIVAIVVGGIVGGATWYTMRAKPEADVVEIYHQ